MATVSQAPHRYAPFYGKLSKLFDLPETDVRKLLCDMQERRAWRASGLPGVKLFSVRAGASVADAETIFVEFVPGFRYPRHRHGGHESVLVLQGGYRDESGAH